MRSVTLLLVLGALTLGCATSPDDGGTDLDAGSGGPVTDAGPDRTVGAGGEAGADGGGGTPVDASMDAPTIADAHPDAPTSAESGTDAATDAADASDGATAATGMTWPPGQVFPSFPPPGNLDLFVSTSQPSDVLSLVVTLQGLVNRTLPRIFVSDGSTPTKLWLSEMNAVTTTVTDPLALVTKYRSEIAGIVIDDDALVDTLNLATTIAGVKGGIVASPALATTLTAPPYSLPVLADLRTNHFASKLDVYDYELANYASATTHRLIIGLTPAIVDHLRDYAVATQAMTVWLDPTVPAEKTLLGSFLALLGPNSPYMGWWTSEPDGVQTAATYGVPVFAADWSMNLTVLGGTPRGSTPAQVPPPPKLENKFYVAIFMSDGDNLQEDEGLVPLKWADTNRGSVAISWTLSPALVDVGPVMLRYFQRTATPNDVLVSGPSGLGYTYPAAWPSAATFDLYATVSGNYMGAAGLRVATVWNNGADLSAANAQSYLSRVPSLLGLTIQSSTTARQFVSGALPVDRMTVSYADTEAALESGLDSVLAGYDGTKPMFAAIQGNMNSGTIHPTAFANVQNHYVNDTNVVFVRADHYFELMKQANAPAAHRVLSGDFNGDKRTDSLFYYGGNGDFWLGLSDGTTLTWSNAGNVAGFGNLLEGSHALYTGDFTGDGKTDVAFFYAGDNSWWIGASSGAALTWTKASTTSFGNVLDGKHRVSVGDYDGDGRADFAVYSSADGSWSLGISSGTALTWKAAGSTGGFGNLLDGSHAFYDGDFDGDGKMDVLFFYNGDQNLWLGRSSGAALSWAQLGNTSGYGNLIDHGHRLLAGDFDGDHKTDLLFTYAGDGSWWLGISSGTALTWGNAGNTAAAGSFVDLNHRLFTADVDGDGKLDVVSLNSATGDWSVGHSDGSKLTWKSAGNTSGYGDLADPSRLLWLGDYDGDGKLEPLFYYGGDGSWWMSRSDGTTFTWHLAVNTSGFGDLTH